MSLCLIYQPVSILMTGGGGKKSRKIIKSLTSLTDAYVHGSGGWLAKRDLNWSPTREMSELNYVRKLQRTKL